CEGSIRMLIVLFSPFSSCLAGSKLMRWTHASSLHDTDFWAANVLLPDATPAAATTNRSLVSREVAAFMMTSPPRNDCARANVTRDKARRHPLLPSVASPTRLRFFWELHPMSTRF